MATTAARLSALETSLSNVEVMLAALIDAQSPAKVTTTKAAQPKAAKKPAKKAPAKKATPVVTSDKALPKGVRMTRAAGGTLSTKDWNRTLTAKARLAGKRGDVSVYSLVLADWAAVQEARKSGLTPDEVLALV